MYVLACIPCFYDSAPSCKQPLSPPFIMSACPFVSGEIYVFSWVPQIANEQLLLQTSTWILRLISAHKNYENWPTASYQTWSGGGTRDIHKCLVEVAAVLFVCHEKSSTSYFEWLLIE